MRNWKIRVIHLSHTDIGYKDLQTKILHQQTQNLIDVVNNLKTNKSLENKWKWNIECFGTLEHFLNNNPKLENDLIDLINHKLIGVSANYWGFSKLPSYELINSAFKRVSEFSKKLISPIKSLITNDINGYGLSWAHAAKQNGIENLFFGLHTHHGFYPVFRKQYPFWWKLPSGQKVLVWIGEQYAFGNNMGLVPGPMSDYIAKDMLNAGENKNEQFALANKRIKEYLDKLDEDGYGFDVVPISTLGTGADNDPANYEIKDRCEQLLEEWKQYGVTEVTMVTLDEFFEEIRSQNVEIPTYEGDWPDWWTDGVASMPMPLRAFREAQRNYKAIKSIGREDLNNELSKIEDDLLLYSEHTYGTEDPIRFAHSQYNFTVEKIKSVYALRALNDTLMIYDKLTSWKSYRQHDLDIIKFRITNPCDEHISKSINITKYLGWIEAQKIVNHQNILIYDESKNSIKYSLEIVPHPSVPAWSGKEVILHLNLKPQEIKEVTIDLSKISVNVQPMTSSFATISAEWADDVENINIKHKGMKLVNDVLTTNNFIISFDSNGIKQIEDVHSGKLLINEEFDNLFKPVYFVSKIPYVRNDLFLQRRYIGKNRISDLAHRYDGKLISKEVKFTKDFEDATIILKYEVESTKFYEVEIKLSNYHSRFDVNVNINKDTEWSIESLFIALPFKGNVELDYDYLYQVDKGQLPGTLIDYHSIQEGIVFDRHVYVAQLDAALVWTGPFSYGQRSLAHQTKFDWSKQCTYTYALNNNWETNFPADTSGFHCFRYVITLANDVNKPEEKLRALATNVLVERI